jgi:hypothetical protein
MISADRLKALSAWWGLPAAGDGAMDRQIERFQKFVFDLQQTYGQAYKDQLDDLLCGNESLGRAVQEFWRCRRPPELLAAESEFMAALLERASLRARRWAQLTEKFEECCAALARDAAAEFRQQQQEAPPVKGDGAMQAQAAKAPRPPSTQA